MRLVYLFLAVLGFAGCATSPSSKTSYLLRSDVTLESRSLQYGSVPICIAQVEVANYLDQPGLVTVQSNGAVHVAQHSYWAEPLRKSLPSFIAMELSAALQEDIQVGAAEQPGVMRVTIRVDQLHGAVDGHAVLVAFWSYQLDGERVEFQYTQRHPMKSNGYAALVDAQHVVLRGLASEIAAELRARRQL